MRTLKLALLIFALIPAVYIKVPRPPPVGGAQVVLQDLMPALRQAGPLPEAGGLRLEGAWRLTSDNGDFGNFSGLAQAKPGIVAVGDRGGVMMFTRPDLPGPWQPRLRRLITEDWRVSPHGSDAEAVAAEPETGALLVAYEDAPALQRFSADLATHTAIPVPVLREWPPNQGPEAMAHIADHRTIIVGEAYARWFDRSLHTGLIFAGEPRPYETPARFTLKMPAGYRPSELAPMPDGRLLVLGRSFSFAGFRSVIAVFDAAAVRPGATIVPRVIARINDPRIRENYEGMTVTREPGGNLAIWLISDSNEMVWAQRTLLLKLRLALPAP
jgi:hypothetical protein